MLMKLNQLNNISLSLIEPLVVSLDQSSENLEAQFLVSNYPVEYQQLQLRYSPLPATN